MATAKPTKKKKKRLTEAEEAAAILRQTKAKLQKAKARKDAKTESVFVPREPVPVPSMFGTPPPPPPAWLEPYDDAAATDDPARTKDHVFAQASLGMPPLSRAQTRALMELPDETIVPTPNDIVHVGLFLQELRAEDVLYKRQETAFWEDYLLEKYASYGRRVGLHLGKKLFLATVEASGLARPVPTLKMARWEWVEAAFAPKNAPKTAAYTAFEVIVPAGAAPASPSGPTVYTEANISAVCRHDYQKRVTAFLTERLAYGVAVGSDWGFTCWRDFDADWCKKRGEEGLGTLSQELFWTLAQSSDAVRYESLLGTVRRVPQPPAPVPAAAETTAETLDALVDRFLRWLYTAKRYASTFGPDPKRPETCREIMGGFGESFLGYKIDLFRASNPSRFTDRDILSGMEKSPLVKWLPLGTYRVFDWNHEAFGTPPAVPEKEETMTEAKAAPCPMEASADAFLAHLKTSVPDWRGTLNALDVLYYRWCDKHGRAAFASENFRTYAAASGRLEVIVSSDKMYKRYTWKDAPLVDAAAPTVHKKEIVDLMTDRGQVRAFLRDLYPQRNGCGIYHASAIFPLYAAWMARQEKPGSLISYASFKKEATESGVLYSASGGHLAWTKDAPAKLGLSASDPAPSPAPAPAFEPVEKEPSPHAPPVEAWGYLAGTLGLLNASSSLRVAEQAHAQEIVATEIVHLVAPSVVIEKAIAAIQLAEAEADAAWKKTGETDRYLAGIADGLEKARRAIDPKAGTP